MKDSYFVDFHQGWLIEIEPLNQAFKATCYSPCRNRLAVQELYASEFDALYAAKQAIDVQVACKALSDVLREVYDAGQLSFEEWTSLQNSLVHPLQNRESC